jgi:hypothetical protein
MLVLVLPRSDTNKQRHLRGLMDEVSTLFYFCRQLEHKTKKSDWTDGRAGRC